MADPEKVRSEIVAMLKDDPRGLSVTEISRKAGLNRNSTARYLDVLQVSGRIEMRNLGKAKLYYPSYSVPIAAMLNFSSDLIMVLDRTGSVLEMNRNLLGLLGSRREMMVGTNLFDSPLPIIEGMDLRKVLRKVVKGNDHMFEVNMNLEDRTVHLRGRMLPTSLSDGSKGVTVILEDVTDKKRSELKLKESENRYRTLFDNSLDALLIVDEDRILDANDAALTLYGLSSKEEIIGKRSYDFSPTKQPDGTDSAEMIKWGMGEVLKGKTFNFEWVQLKKGRGPVLTLMTVRPIILNGKTMVHAMMRDMTDSKLSEDRVKAAEERLRKAASSLHDSLITLLDQDRYMTELWASERTKERLGDAFRKGLVVRMDDIVAGEDREEFSTRLNRVLSTGGSDRMEVRILLDGEPHWSEVRSDLTTDPVTKERTLVLFVSDITEQRKLRESLEATVHRTMVLDATLRDIIWMTDEGFNFIFMSSSVRRVLGFTPEELIGKGMENVLTDRSMKKLRKAVSELLHGSDARRKAAATPYLLEIESVRKDATRVWTEVSISVHHEATDGPVRIIGATRDISRRKGAERDLMKFSKAFHFSNEAMIITDDRSRIIDINPSAVRLLGASDRKELLGTVGLSLLVPEEIDKAVKAMRDSEPTPRKGLVYTIRDKSGIVRAVEVFSSPIPGEDGSTEGFIVLLRAVSS